MPGRANDAEYICMYLCCRQPAPAPAKGAALSPLSSSLSLFLNMYARPAPHPAPFPSGQSQEPGASGDFLSELERIPHLFLPQTRSSPSLGKWAGSGLTGDSVLSLLYQCCTNEDK